MLKSIYLCAHYELQLMSCVFLRCPIKLNLVSPKKPIFFISCLATVALFSKKYKDLFIYIFIYLFSLPGISIWNTLLHINSLLSNRLCV